MGGLKSHWGSGPHFSANSGRLGTGEPNAL
jgi:hypothetical protein